MRLWATASPERTDMSAQRQGACFSPHDVLLPKNLVTRSHDPGNLGCDWAPQISHDPAPTPRGHIKGHGKGHGKGQVCRPWPGGSVGQSSRCTKVVGSIRGQGTYTNPPTNISISGTTNRCVSLSKSISMFFKLRVHPPSPCTYPLCSTESCVWAPSSLGRCLPRWPVPTPPTSVSSACPT